MAEGKIDTIKYLVQRNNGFRDSVRVALDPDSLYPDITDVVSLAEDITRGAERLFRKIDRQRKELEERL